MNPITVNYERPWIADYQREVIDSDKRILVVEASTKAGKTVIMILWIFEQALKGKDGDHCWWVAPVYSQAKIAFSRLKRFIKNKDLFRSNESDLSITLFNGVTIEFKSADKPDNLYGEDVIAAVSDESSRHKDESMIAVFSTLTATRGKWRLIGNVKGIDNYAYKLGLKVKNGELPDSGYFKITADDAVKAGILSQEAIDYARSTLDPDWFDELYFCIARKPVDKPWAYAFKEDKHTTEGLKIDPRLPLFLSFDFNVDPMTCMAAQHHGPWVRIIEEIRIMDSDTYEMCKHIKSTFLTGPNAPMAVKITGDASGKNQSTTGRRGARSNFQIIQTELGIPDRDVYLPRANPRHAESRPIINGFLHNHPDFLIDREKCPYLVKDLKLVESNPDDSIVKPTSAKQAHLTHLFDAFRYYIHSFHHDWFRRI